MPASCSLVGVHSHKAHHPAHTHHHRLALTSAATHGGTRTTASPATTHHLFILSGWCQCGPPGAQGPVHIQLRASSRLRCPGARQTAPVQKAVPSPARPFAVLLPVTHAAHHFGCLFWADHERTNLRHPIFIRPPACLQCTHTINRHTHTTHTKGAAATIQIQIATSPPETSDPRYPGLHQRPRRLNTSRRPPAARRPPPLQSMPPR